MPVQARMSSRFGLPGRRGPARVVSRRLPDPASLAMACAFAAWFAAAPATAPAATFTWTDGGANNFASNPANWNPAQVPAAADDLVFPGLGNQFVNFDAPVPASRSWRVFGLGTYDLFVSARHTIELDLLVGNGSQSGLVGLSTLDTVVIQRDIEILSGELSVQQGCRVIGVDSIRVSKGTFTLRDLNTVVWAKDLLLGAPGSSAFATVTRGRLLLSQSLRVGQGNLLVGESTARLEAPSFYAGPSAIVYSNAQGLIQVAGEFTLDGMLSLDAGRVAASPLRASATATVSGNGIVDGRFLLEGGYLVVVTGKLTVGDAADPSGVQMEGFVSLDYGTELECLSASPVALPATVNVGSATLRAPTGVVLGDSDYMTASGRVAGDFDMTGGALQFWYTGAAPPSLTVEGDWSMGAAASMTVNVYDLGGSWAAESLVVTGVAQPGGTLNVGVPFPAPSSGQSIPFLFYASRPSNRVFDEVLVNGVPLSDELEVVYLADRAVLQFAGSVGVAGQPGLPERLALAGTGGSGRPGFALDLPEDASVTLDVFDVTGRRVAGLHDGPLAAGRHRFGFVRGDAGSTAFASGVYFGRAMVRSTAGREEARSARLVLAR